MSRPAKDLKKNEQILKPGQIRKPRLLLSLAKIQR